LRRIVTIVSSILPIPDMRNSHLFTVNKNNVEARRKQSEIPRLFGSLGEREQTDGNSPRDLGSLA